MKRLLISAVAVLVIAASFASCYDPYSGIKDKNYKPKTTTEATTAKETKSSSKTVSSDKYADSFDGLRDYMKDCGYIKTDDENNIKKMQADLIGAEKGYKYTDGDTRVELYSFDLSKKNDTRDKVIESVKKDGTFIMYSETIPAYLSDNGKYLMVYSNPATSDKNSDAYKTMQSAVKAFKSFKADSTEEATEKATEKTTEKTKE